MGTTTSKNCDLASNKYIIRFCQKGHISPNDPFWNSFLSFTFTPPIKSSENEVLDERIQPILRQLLVNNLHSGNVGSLLQVFLSRSKELLASTQTENTMFSWQTYNALFILRCIVKFFVENIKEEDVIRQIEVRNQQKDASVVTEEHTNRTEAFIHSLMEIIVEVPLREFTYPLHLEAVNCMLVLLSVQMFSQKPAAKLYIYRCIMQGHHTIHATNLMNSLLQKFIDEDKAPPGLCQNTSGGSLVINFASDIWNILTWGLSRGPQSQERTDHSSATLSEKNAPLANQSLLLILVLANHCTGERNLNNPYRQALFNFNNSNGTTQSQERLCLDFSRLYETLCRTVNTDQCTLLVYLLIHRNQFVRTFILARSDIEHLVIPILRTLYHAPDSSSHHIYMSLIILLILSEDNLFNETVHETMLKGVPWYTERSISEISLGGLLVLVIIRTIQYNMLKMRDKYLHTNCLAALANMSSQFRNLHPYVTQRLVSLFETLARKHTRLEEQLHQGTSDVAIAVEDGDVNSDLAQDISVLEEVLRMVLEVLNSCLSHQLVHNSNLIYTLLYKKHVFDPYRNHQAFQDIIQNIDAVEIYFSNKLSQLQKHLSVGEVQRTIQQGALEWRKDKLKKFPELKFKYVEEEQPEDFFIPYVWSLVTQTSGLYWNPMNNKLLVPDSSVVVL